jgi:hypothetical protein
VAFYQPPLLLTYCTRCHPVIAGLDPGLDPAISIGWLLTGIASFASYVRVEMARP